MAGSRRSTSTAVIAEQISEERSEQVNQVNNGLRQRKGRSILEHDDDDPIGIDGDDDKKARSMPVSTGQVVLPSAASGHNFGDSPEPFITDGKFKWNWRRFFFITALFLTGAFIGVAVGLTGGAALVPVLGLGSAFLGWAAGLAGVTLSAGLITGITVGIFSALVATAGALLGAVTESFIQRRERYSAASDIVLDLKAAKSSGRWATLSAIVMGAGIFAISAFAIATTGPLAPVIAGLGILTSGSIAWAFTAGVAFLGGLVGGIVKKSIEFCAGFRPRRGGFGKKGHHAEYSPLQQFNNPQQFNNLQQFNKPLSPSTTKYDVTIMPITWFSASQEKQPSASLRASQEEQPSASLRASQGKPSDPLRASQEQNAASLRASQDPEDEDEGLRSSRGERLAKPPEEGSVSSSSPAPASSVAPRSILNDSDSVTAERGSSSSGHETESPPPSLTTEENQAREAAENPHTDTVGRGLTASEEQRLPRLSGSLHALNGGSRSRSPSPVRSNSGSTAAVPPATPPADHGSPPTTPPQYGFGFN